MKPVLYWFTAPLLGRVEIPAYFTLLAVGFGLAMWITYRESKRIQLDPERILDADLWMIVWGIIGARVLHVIADGHFMEYVNLCVNPKLVPAYDPPVKFCNLVAGQLTDPCGPDFLCDTVRHVCYPPEDCFAAFEVWRGGLAYYGGFICAVAFSMYFLRKHKMPLGRVSDLLAPTIAFGLFFGRMGCFLNGCCYGKETDSWIGVRFPKWGSAWHAQVEAKRISQGASSSLAVHPTQLYEAVACLAIAAFLYFVWRPRKRHDWDILAGFMLLYAIARSAIEVFRDDDRGVFLGGWLSTSQILSIPLAALAIYIFWRVRRPAAVPA
ncbi:MAG: prolipoprotein diacylglyceryl transferase [Myxococcales bacterium]|nr:prolipoprotein diacylglyceryl transferase [Myxococcales bacterium]